MEDVIDFDFALTPILEASCVDISSPSQRPSEGPSFPTIQSNLQAVDGKADLVPGLGKRLCARSSEEASRCPGASSSLRKGAHPLITYVYSLRKEGDSGSTTTPFGAVLTGCHPHTIYL